MGHTLDLERVSSNKKTKFLCKMEYMTRKCRQKTSREKNDSKVPLCWIYMSLGHAIIQ